jgi:hypothetical protein
MTLKEVIFKLLAVGLTAYGLHYLVLMLYDFMVG